ncbi:MAG: peptidase domain-containing ABC transporter [Prevotella sp.]|nr:peptidase domain-containing ABC transporter [Prevotella sp.]
MSAFKNKYQVDSMDCGPACLCMIAKYYGKDYSLKYFRENSFVTREGVSMRGISIAAEKVGLHTLCAKITIDQLANEINLPCVLHWNKNHYVVCYKVTGKGDKRIFHISDPAIGKLKYNIKNLYKHWISGKFEGEDVGIAMQVEPGADFYIKERSQEAKDTFGLRFFLRYILPHKWQIAQLLFGAMIVMILGYFLPFVSQSVVDIGIMGRDLNFILLMMFVQLVISISQTSIVFVQSWLSLHMNTVINISLISDYLRKLANTPLHFFEIRTMGDILQRIGDHNRIKNFLMNDMVDIVFSIGTFITFSTVLGIYNWRILAIFLTGNTIYIAWVLSFMRYRRELDHKAFQQSAALQNNMVQFIQGMQEIKLNNIEKQKCWEWEHLQAHLYKLSRRAMMLGQIQSAGSIAFSSTTNILLSYMTARMVVTGEMTLGMMTSLSFIIGQVAGPMGAFIGFAQRYQDAKISLERLGDIHTQGDEHEGDDKKQITLPLCRDIRVHDMNFSYSGAERDLVLKGISLHIPENKVTAIVGKSGCGKTTLIKLMQGLYQPTSGEIFIGDVPLTNIKKRVWREEIGAVMQDGYIFSDSIANNIVVYNSLDKARLIDAVEKVNMKDFIENLPQGYNTKIGNDGLQLSQGQRQRVLLARVIYKTPNYLFLDEATNALDTQNEYDIMHNIKKSFQGHTTVIVAHRLSTIRNADHIIVMDDGKIVEQGKHDELIEAKGHYYKLVQAQINQIS